MILLPFMESVGVRLISRLRCVDMVNKEQLFSLELQLHLNILFANLCVTLNKTQISGVDFVHLVYLSAHLQCYLITNKLVTLSTFITRLILVTAVLVKK